MIANRQLANRLRTGAGGVVPFTASHRISFNSRGSARSDSRKSSLFDRTASGPVIGFFTSSGTRGGSVEKRIWVQALCFSRGKQRFSVAGKSSMWITRFSAGRGKRPGLKPVLNLDRPSAGLKSSSPLLKQRASTDPFPPAQRQRQFYRVGAKMRRSKVPS
jgi:hypothetical protein